MDEVIELFAAEEDKLEDLSAEALEELSNNKGEDEEDE